MNNEQFLTNLNEFLSQLELPPLPAGSTEIELDWKNLGDIYIEHREEQKLVLTSFVFASKEKLSEKQMALLLGLNVSWLESDTYIAYNHNQSTIQLSNVRNVELFSSNDLYLIIDHLLDKSRVLIEMLEQPSKVTANTEESMMHFLRV